MQGVLTEQQNRAEERGRTLSEAMKGSHNPFYGKHHTEEARRKMVQSHRNRRLTEDWKRKIGEASRQVWQDPQRKEKMGERMKRLWQDPEYRAKVIASRTGRPSPMLGKHHTEETKAKIRQKLKGKKWSQEWIAKHRANPTRYWLDKKMPPELRQKLSQIRKGRKFSEGHKKRIAEALKIHCRNPIVRQRRSEMAKVSWQDPMIRPKMLEGARKGGEATWSNPRSIERWVRSQALKPNESEKTLLKLITKVVPNEYRYVGDGQVIIDGKLPDFINCNGQKKIIELFGDFWHRGEDPQTRINAFRKFGFDTLVVWEHELKQPKLLADKIHQFTQPEVLIH